jgi:hypothetical protein
MSIAAKNHYSMTTIPIYYYISQNHTADLVNPQRAMPLRTHLATTDLLKNTDSPQLAPSAEFLAK